MRMCYQGCPGAFWDEAGKPVCNIERMTVLADITQTSTARRLATVLRFFLIAAAVALLFDVPPQAIAIDSNTYFILNDRGGDVETRMREIQFASLHYQKIEIGGEVCLSSCTIFLGLPQVCVHPNTRFGFHGPTDHGAPLNQERFEYWSKLIASYYPPQLQHWYMTKARYLTKGYFSLSGKYLIRLGLRSC